MSRSGTRLWPMVAMFCIFFSSLALADTVTVKYNWSIPIDGADVDLYRAEMRFGEDEEGPFGPWGEMGTSSEPFFTFTFTKGLWYQVRVRAQDHQGDLSPYSPISAVFGVPVIPGEGTGEGVPPLPPDDIDGPVDLSGGSGGGSD